MMFDGLTVVLLLANPRRPEQDAATEDTVQDAHLSYLATLHEAGHLLAAGPLPGPSDRAYRGMILFKVDPDRAAQLMADDPAVRAGWFTVHAMPWLIPTGAMHFTPTRFPRSTAEVDEN